MVSTLFAVLNEHGLVWMTWRPNILKKLLVIIPDSVQHWIIIDCVCFCLEFNMLSKDVGFLVGLSLVSLILVTIGLGFITFTAVDVLLDLL